MSLLLYSLTENQVAIFPAAGVRVTGQQGYHVSVLLNEDGVHVIRIDDLDLRYNVAGIILNEAENVRAIDAAKGFTFGLRDHDLDAVLQQRIAVGGLHLCPGVGIVLQALEDQLAVLRRDEVGSVLFLGYMIGHIPNALGLVELADEEITIRIVVDDKLHFGEVSASIGKLLRHVDAVDIDVAIVHEGIIVRAVRALPGEDNIVRVASVAVGHRGVAVHCGLIGNAEGAIAVPAVDHAGLGVDAAVAVDLRKAGGCHGDRHNARAVRSGVVAHEETVRRLVPGGHKIGAAVVPEELQQHVALVVGDAFAERVNKGVVGEIGRGGGDAGEGGNDLIVDHVARRGRAGVSIAVVNVTCAAVVMPGVVLALAQRLFEAGDAREVFRIERHIVNPAGAAVVGIGAVNGGHGQRDEERRGSVRDHFRDAGFDQQIQAEGQIRGSRMAVGIRLRHGYAVVVVGIAFQRIFDCGGVGVQRRLETVDQHVGAIVIHGHAVYNFIGGRVAIFGADADCREKGVVLFGGGNTVQHFDVFRAVLALGKGANICDLHISKLHAFDGIPVGAAVGVQRRDAGRIAQHGLHAAFILDAGADIGAVPNAVFLGVGKVVFVNVQRAGPGGVNRGLVHRGGEGRNGKAAHYQDSKQQRKEFLQVSLSSFRFVMM